MGKSKNTINKQIKSKLLKYLSYNHISKLTFSEYQSFVFDLFYWLESLKNEKINFDELVTFVKGIYYKESEYFDDIMFERRFVKIAEEIYHFCSKPYFWETNYEIYILKWHEIFESSWLKEIE